jgi:VanZ family protein
MPNTPLRHFWREVWFWGPPIAYAAFLFYLSSRPVPTMLAPPEGFDKLAHFAAYAVLGALCARALLFALRRSARGVMKVGAIFGGAALGALYGVSDEIHQSFVASRSAEVLDAVADAAGSLAGAALFVGAHTFWAKRRGRPA